MSIAGFRLTRAVPTPSSLPFAFEELTQHALDTWGTIPEPVRFAYDPTACTLTLACGECAVKLDEEIDTARGART